MTILRITIKIKNYFSITTKSKPYLLSSFVTLGHSVEPEELVALEVEVVLDDGHALSHLTEHENSVAGLLQLRQNPIEQFELAGRAVNVGAADDVGKVASVLCV
jgi:hypothetical protein